MRFKQTPRNGLKKRSRQSYRDLNACQGVDGLLPTEFSAQNSKLAYPFWILRKRREKPLNRNLCSIKEYRKNPVNRQSAEKDQQSLESRNEMKIFSQSQSSFTKWNLGWNTPQSSEQSSRRVC